MILMGELNLRVFGKTTKFLRRAKPTMTMAGFGRMASGKTLNSTGKAWSWILRAGLSMMDYGGILVKMKTGSFIGKMAGRRPMRVTIGSRSSRGKEGCLMQKAICSMLGAFWKMPKVVKVRASMQRMGTWNILALGSMISDMEKVPCTHKLEIRRSLTKVRGLRAKNLVSGKFTMSKPKIWNTLGIF
jgi:hypothetical protein